MYSEEMVIFGVFSTMLPHALSTLYHLDEHFHNFVCVQIGFVMVIQIVWTVPMKMSHFIIVLHRSHAATICLLVKMAAVLIK